jgi:regulator of replication initiation timing
MHFFLLPLLFLLFLLVLKHRREAARWRAKAQLLSAAVERLAAEAEALHAQVEKMQDMITAYIDERSRVRTECAEAVRRLEKEKTELERKLASLAASQPTAQPKAEDVLWARPVGGHFAVGARRPLGEVWIRVPTVDILALAAVEEALARRHGVAAVAVRRIRELMSKTVLEERGPNGSTRIEVPLRPPAVYVREGNSGVIAWRPAPPIDMILRNAKKEDEGYLR